MPTSIEKLCVLSVALFFAGMGLSALIDPQGTLRFFSPPVFEADMRNEVRAVYGGYGLAVAALLLATFRWPAIATGARIAIAVSLLGMAGGRVVSLLIEPASSNWPLAFIAVEVVLAAILLAASKPTNA